MCRAVTCKKCGKTTWAGCGQHVDQVMAKVPKPEQCTCSANAPDDSGAKSGPGFISRILGRG